MTDKEQIIVNGVDVSGCRHLKNDGIKKPICRGGGCTAIYKSCLCVNNTDCDYKQLARKTQELETICRAFDIEYGYDEETGAIVGRCNKLIEKEKELEEYKQSLDEKNKFLQDLGISASGEFKRIKFYIEDLKNKYNEKVEEYEELISEKDFYLQKIETLEEKLNAQFAEMEEKLTAEEMKNFELKEEIRELKDYIRWIMRLQ